MQQSCNYVYHYDITRSSWVSCRVYYNLKVLHLCTEHLSICYSASLRNCDHTRLNSGSFSDRVRAVCIGRELVVKCVD